MTSNTLQCTSNLVVLSTKHFLYIFGNGLNRSNKSVPSIGYDIECSFQVKSR